MSFPQSRAGLAEFSSPRNLSVDLPPLFSLLPLLNSFLVLSFSPPKLAHPTAGPFLSLVHGIIKTKPTQCMKAFLKSSSGRPREAGYRRYRQACERFHRRAAGCRQHLSSRIPISSAADSQRRSRRFKYVFPSFLPREFSGERKRSLKEIICGQFSMPQRYTRPRDFSSAKLNNRKSEKLKGEIWESGRRL